MVEIVGVKRMEGTSKKSGRPYSGYMVWYEQEEQGVTGRSADSAFISDELLQGMIPGPGMLADLRYNKNGYLTDVRIS